MTTTSPVTLTSVRGHVWLDVNEDSVQISEPDFEGISVKLVDGANNVFVASTDINGNFFFPNAATGSGTLLTTVPDGFVITTGPNPLMFAIPITPFVITPIGLFPLNGTTGIPGTTPSVDRSETLSEGSIVGIIIGVVLLAVLLVIMCTGLYVRAMRTVSTKTTRTITVDRHINSQYPAKSQSQFNARNRTKIMYSEV